MRNPGPGIGPIMLFTVMILALTGTAGEIRAAEMVGEIVAVRGEAVVIRGDVAVPASVHAALLIDDEIRTGADGRVKILFEDDSLMTVGRNSSAVVAEFLRGAGGAKGSSAVSLLRGTIRSIVGGNGLTVRTPTALAAARGTDFFTRASEDLTEVAVVEDRVWVRNADAAVEGEIEVPEGFMVRVFKGRPPLDPERFTRDLLDGLRDATDVRIAPAVEKDWTEAGRYAGMPGALQKLERTYLRDLIQRELDREPAGEVPVDVIVEIPER